MNQQRPENNNYEYYPFNKESLALRFFKKLGNAILDRLFNIFVSLVMLILFIIIIIAIAMSFSKNTPVAPVQKSFMEISFPAGINETPTDLFTKDYLSLYEVIGAIDEAQNDSNIKGIILKLDHLFLSSEKAAEIGKKLEEYKAKTGKKVYAYGNYISAGNYKLALYADEIVMTPSNSAVFSLEGYAGVYPYFRGLSDKAGVKFNVVHIGDFKTYGENLSRGEMSPELKSEITRIYDAAYTRLINKIVEKRGISDEVLRAGIVEGTFAILNPFEAKEKGFIDTIVNYDEFMVSIGAVKGKEKLVTPINNYVQNAGKHVTPESMNRIAVIFAEGDITMNDEEHSAFGSEEITPRKMTELIDMVINDETIKGVVIRVNSPGGSALASEIILQKIAKLKERKTVYVSMGDVAASGGYYISSKADKIFAESNTITGSIGVVAVFPNFKGLTDKLGINFETVKYGKYADLGNGVRDTTSEEVEVIRNTMLKTYTEFKDRVSEGRNIEAAELEKIAQGRIWSGDEAVKIGLADVVGGMDDAVKAMAEEKKLKNYDVVPIKKPLPFADMLKYEIARNISVNTGYEIPFIKNPEIKKAAEAVSRFEKYNKYEMLMIMPYDINSGGAI